MKPTWLKILMGVGAGAAAAVAAIAAGPVTAVLVGVSAGVSTIAALYHTAPKDAVPSDKKKESAS